MPYILFVLWAFILPLPMVASKEMNLFYIFLKKGSSIFHHLLHFDGWEKSQKNSNFEITFFIPFENSRIRLHFSQKKLAAGKNVDRAAKVEI